MRSRSFRPLPLALAALLLAPTASTAQSAALGFLGGVFSNITDLNAGFIWGSTRGANQVIADSGGFGLRGLAIEATFGLGNFIPWGKTCTSGAPLPEDPPKPKDPAKKEVHIYHRTGNTLDSISVIQPKAPEPCERYGLTGELGFGYAQTGRFRGNTVTASGAIEEIPFLTLYGAVETESDLTPYAGLRGGLVQLKDFRTTVSGVGAKGSGSTFEYGALLGLGWNLSANAVVFAEMAWMYRTFDGIEWTPTTVVIPEALLKPLELDTRTLTVGVQIVFKKKT